MSWKSKLEWKQSLTWLLLLGALRWIWRLNYAIWSLWKRKLIAPVYSSFLHHVENRRNVEMTMSWKQCFVLTKIVALTVCNLILWPLLALTNGVLLSLESPTLLLTICVILLLQNHLPVYFCFPHFILSLPKQGLGFRQHKAGTKGVTDDYLVKRVE